MKTSDLFHLNPQNVLAARPGKNELLIVGIGASAGGVQALKTFFEHVPADSGMAYVVILHLSLNHDSKLAEVLQHATKMPVVQITQKTKVAANHVYVIPPDRQLTMSDGHILVTQNIEEQDRRAPVDIFFRTLAASHGPRAVCVILSGTGANGSMGLKHIKEMGGAAFVQNPREAEYNEMPRNSIATDLVDDVLPVAEIPAKIMAYKKGLGSVEIPVEAEKRAEEQQATLHTYPISESVPLFNDTQSTTAAQEQLVREHGISSNEPVARQLEEELMRLKAQLRASIEQHEFQAEELKASNEKLQAMNEELRSAAEELRTVNQELKMKVEETTLASNNFQNLINSVDFGTIFLDRSLRVALFTPLSRSLFNLIPNNIGRPLSDITNKLEYNDLIADAETVLDKLHTIEREVKAKDGRQFLLRILPYRTEEDRINGVVITFFDITERKNSEEALRKSEENFRVFFTASSDALYKMSPDWSEMYELKGMNFLANMETPSRSWLKTYIPAEEHAKVLASIQHAIESKSIFELEHKVIKADGKIGWASTRAVPLLDSNNEIIDWFGVASDVTKRKLTEEALRESTERLRITLESATDYAIITLDTEGKIQSWSRGAEVIFGYTENEVIGINAAMFNTPEDRAAHTLEKEIKQAADKGRAVDERWHLRKDGTKFFTIGVMTPIISDNKLVGFVLVARDMTEQKLVEQQKDEFIGIASHELKTPITSIKIYAETLQEKFEEANDKENTMMMQKLNNQVDRLTALIRDLLDTTKIFEGKLLLHTEKFDLNKLIDDRIEEWQRISPNHVIRLLNDKEIKVSADKERISQVLTNFISNAIKYSPKGGDITIRTEEEGSNVKVSVQDHGIGIPKELVNYIFNRFYRVSNLQTHNYPGMGLGLYISAGIIKRHGGTIGVESIEGDGSTFYFTLPAKNNRG